jgi:hypothetical protein
MELLCIASKVPVELLWVLCLIVILLLLIDDVLEFHIACVAVATACVLTDALVMECMATHEMDCWQAQRLLTAVTLLRVEVLGFGFQVLNLGAHSFYFAHVFVNLLVVLLNDSILNLKSIQKVLFDNLELKVWL